MKEFRVIWTEQAKTDLEEILLYIARESAEIAARKYEELKIAASRLKDFPQTGRIIPELEEQNITTYRELVVSPWRIMYKIEREEVYILALLDGRRNIEDILLKRQLTRRT